MAIPSGSAESSTRGAGVSHRQTPYRVLAAACIGNALEWYDIVVYSYFASFIAKVFFPTHNPTSSLLLALGTFAVSFLIRPVGAIVLGSYADRAGRKPALSLSILLMVLGTFLITAMPSYETIGIIAPCGILLARLIQGFSAGGEFGSATALMVEHLPHRRGYAASWQFTSQAAATLLAASLGTFLTSALTNDQMLSWGFRIPFAVGMLVGPVGYYIRRRVPEAPEFVAAGLDGDRRTPGRQVLREHKGRVLLTIGVLAFTTSLNYLISYMPTYAIRSLHLPASTGFAATLVAATAVLLTTPLAGHWSDRFGQIRLMVPAAGLVLVLICPLFALLVAFPGLGTMLAVMFLLGVLKAPYSGPMGALLANLFPPNTRATGMALGYNIGVAIFGGFTPLIAAWLTTSTGTDLAPSFWVITTAIVSLTCLAVIRKKIGLR